MEWITDLAKKKPSDKQKVIITTNPKYGNNEVKQAIFCKKYINQYVDDINVYVTGENGYYRSDQIAAWMPEPKAYIPMQDDKEKLTDYCLAIHIDLLKQIQVKIHQICSKDELVRIDLDNILLENEKTNF